ncbi:MAG: hypothetical protein K2W95_23010 [Candidatus Obscuribacterales bacterium]|nr:hypothetical protein [Candidatus Obscuribacterales bacterium]
MANVEELKTDSIDANCALAAVLRARRQEFNERFLHARHAKPTLDPTTFKQVLATVICPVVEAWSRYPQVDKDEAAGTLYDIALELTGAGLLGQIGKPESLDDAWRIVLPSAPHLVKSDCAGFASTVTNSVYNVSRVPGAKRSLFVYELARLAAVCPDLKTLRDAGKILAWRCGLAHYRDGALDACTGLGWDFVGAAMGFSEVPNMTLPDFQQRLRDDPWMHPFSAAAGLPSTSMRIAKQVGAFRGYGGQFLRPPEVVASDEDFYATDGEGWWLLCVDIFGNTFTRCPEPSNIEVRRPNDLCVLQAGAEAVLQNARGFIAEAFGKSAVSAQTERREDDFTVSADGVIRSGEDKISVPKADKITSFASAKRTLLATTTTSHKIMVIARPSMLI